MKKSCGNTQKNNKKNQTAKTILKELEQKKNTNSICIMFLYITKII